jgi:hypothetical protein
MGPQRSSHDRNWEFHGYIDPLGSSLSNQQILQNLDPLPLPCNATVPKEVISPSPTPNHKSTIEQRTLPRYRSTDNLAIISKISCANYNSMLSLGLVPHQSPPSTNPSQLQTFQVRST